MNMMISHKTDYNLHNIILQFHPCRIKQLQLVEAVGLKLPQIIAISTRS